VIRDVPSSICWPAKQERPAGGWPAEPPPTIKSVQCLKKREKKRERIMDPASNDFSLLPFISLHAICSFCPCHAHCPIGTSDIFSDLI
jgi:hypothetical protein